MQEREEALYPSLLPVERKAGGGAVGEIVASHGDGDDDEEDKKLKFSFQILHWSNSLYRFWRRIFLSGRLEKSGGNFSVVANRCGGCWRFACEMALKFLNKKGWHTGSLRNIETVWKAEQKHEGEQKKLEELRKQIQDEREKSEFRLMQEQAGLVP